MTDVLVITGTGTGVGKTIVTAALASVAAAAGRRVAVVKPVQTGLQAGEPGDVDDISRLSGVTECHELLRFPDPLAPEAAARVAGLPPADLAGMARWISMSLAEADLVLVEGAGGLLVRFDPQGGTIADLAKRLRAQVLVVADPALGTLNHTALTLSALAARRMPVAGVVLGSWPADPDLACRTNLTDLPTVIGAPLAGAIPAGAGSLDRAGFGAIAEAGLAPSLGGRFNGIIGAAPL